MVSVVLLAVALGGVLYGVGRARHSVGPVADVGRNAPRGGSGSDAVLPGQQRTGAATPHAPTPTPARTATATTRQNASRLASKPLQQAKAKASAQAQPLARSTPLALAIPSVRLQAPLLGLGMDGKGAAELPPFSLPRTAGWLRDSASPGESGTAVVVGHVDTTTGPAVFWNLAAVRPGAEVDVTRLDGRTAVFTVDLVRAYPKAGFPSAQVYGPSPGAQLRVVTCGGAFDRGRHEYTGNVVLFAHLSGVR
ncbi:class F sortase [Streptacidiphilus sp. MAP12-33]|uniref:class F sortase n=1 Tax=Streptacidiphilus sp. MAP12-33 TaxID=3156266 RepID=UPI0035140642